MPKIVLFGQLLAGTKCVNKTCYKGFSDSL